MSYTLRLLAGVSSYLFFYSTAIAQPQSPSTQIEESKSVWTRPDKESIEFLGLMNRASLGLSWKDLASSTIAINRVEAAIIAGLNPNSFGLSQEDGKSVLLKTNAQAIALTRDNLDVLFMVQLKESGFQNPENFATSTASKQVYLNSFKGQIDHLSLLLVLPNGNISLDVSAGPRYSGWKCHGHAGVSMCGAGMPNNWCEQISATSCIGG